MIEFNSLPERMLTAYLGLCTSLWNNRITDGMPFNEALVCNFLFRETDSGEKHMTATELCEMTNIQKSQMNKILSDLEKNGTIRRERSEEDKRVVNIIPVPEKAEIFLKAHEKNINLVKSLQEKFGQEKSEELTELLCELVEIIRQEL